MFRRIRKALCLLLLPAFLAGAAGLMSASAEGAAETVPALPTASAVYVNGAQVTFQAYNIKDYNYFKLRDLAMALNGTSKQFEVAYSGADNAVYITTGKAYTPVGGELTAPEDASVQQALVSRWTVYVDGIKIGLSAYLIGGYNYFKLRDIAAAVGFGVAYDYETTDIQIDTGTGYTDDTGGSDDTDDAAALPNLLIGAWRLDLASHDAEITSHLYRIFSEDGTLTQFIGNKVATYEADDNNIHITKVKVVFSDSYGYTVSTDGSQTQLNIDANQFGLMVRDGVTAETGAGAFTGLWLSKNENFSSGTYFYFTGDGSILMGVVLTGTYTIAETGDAFTDNITADGSLETSSFVITVDNGVTKMILTDSRGRQTTMYKE